MKFLLKLFKPIIQRTLLKELEKQENKASLVKLANDKLDIPKMTEAEEKKFFEDQYDVLKEGLKLILSRI